MAQAAQNAFRVALMQIGFDAPRAEAIIELSGCLNVPRPIERVTNHQIMQTN